MTTQTFTLHLYQQQYQFEDAPSFMLSNHDFLAKNTPERLYIGPREVTVEVPSFQDMRQHQVDALREQEKQLRADFAKNITEIQARIQSLLALEMSA